MNEAIEQRADNLPTSLTGQLIAYIGNKRRLLPFLAPILAGASRERGAFGRPERDSLPGPHVR